MRCATAYSNSCSQVVLVYLQSPSSSLQFTVEVCAETKNCRKSTFSRSMSLMLNHLKACQQLMLQSATSLRLSASTKRANSGKITTFYGSTPLWRPRAEVSLNLGGRDLSAEIYVHAENSTCKLSWSISSHLGAIYSRNVCCSPKSRKKLVGP